MSLRYTRACLLAIPGVRRATYSYHFSTWRVSCWTSDLRQTEQGIASRFRDIGRVQSCASHPAKDPAERCYELVILIPTARNSAQAETTRHRLQMALPYGAARRMAGRLSHNVEEQLEGRNRLSLEVYTEALSELSDEVAAQIADELHAPRRLAVIVRPQTGCTLDVLVENGGLLKAVGAIEDKLAEGLKGDNYLDGGERRNVLAAVVEARTRLQALESALLGNAPTGSRS